MNLISNFLLTAGMIITLIIIAILLFNKKHSLPHKILTVIFGLLFIVLLYSYGELNDLVIIYRLSFIIADTIGFFIGPLLYLYIKFLYQKGNRISTKELVHFSPALIYIITVSAPVLISIWQDKYVFSYLALIDKFNFLLHLQAVYLFIYALLSLRSLKKYNHALKLNYANLSAKDMSWIRYLLIGILLIMVIDILSFVYLEILSKDNWVMNQLATFTLVGVVTYLAYYGTTQARILIPEFILEELSLKTSSDIKPATHHLSNASKEEIEKLKTRLSQLLETEKPYRDENLSLETLAKAIPTSDRKLSALLNHYLNTTFYDLINSYRVDEVKQRMNNKDEDRFTLLALALEAGFNSKTSFNRSFKSVTGLSPSGYKNQIKK